MPRTALPVVNAPDTNASSLQAFVWTPADVANGNQFPHTGREVLLIRNNDAGAQTVTIDSVPDPSFGREKDITAVSIPATEMRVAPFFKPAGWRQTDGNLYVNGNHANIQFAVIRLPS
jgi:hypothetical protein